MRKQLLFICLSFILTTSMVAQTSNNKYEKEWKEVEQSETDGLPQSALNSIDGVLKKAIADKNSTQVIKALIYKNKFKRDIDYNDNEGILIDLQNLANQTSDSAEKALLNSMLAEAYLNYYSANSWQINRRTNLSDIVPEDIKEWTGNIFVNKVADYLQQSVKDITILKKHTTKEFDDIINLGKDTERFPTLYDFLMKRAIEIAQGLENSSQDEFALVAIGLTNQQLTLPADEFVNLNIKADANNRMIAFSYYQKYMKDLLQRNMTPTIILMEIGKTSFLQSKSQSFLPKDALNVYLSLEKKYESNENCSEIIAKIVDSYDYGIDRMDIVKVNETKYTWLKKGINKYPDSYGARILKQKLDELEVSSLAITGKSLQYPNEDNILKIQYKNTQADSIPAFSLLKLVNGKYTLVKEYPLSLTSKTTYNADTLSLNIGKLQPGRYTFTTQRIGELNKEIKKTADEDEDEDYYYDNSNNRFDFIITALLTFSRNSAENEYEIFVVNRKNGSPIKNATVNIYPYERDKNKKKKNILASLKTDENGIATFKDSRKTKDSYPVAIYKAELGTDSCLQVENLNSNSYRWRQSTSDNTDKTVINVFTDRSIYRPGQTVYFKAILIDKDSKSLTNLPCTVILYNANNEEVSKKEVTTNEFGSISGEFILPQTGLPGQYKIVVNSSSGVSYFNVEEYKRPTFEITFDKLKETYAFGEEIKLKGYARNYSGVNLQGVDVKYTITREPFSFWRWGGGYKAPFAKDTVKTNEDGSFEIVFTPQPGEEKRYSPFNQQNYTFEITAAVTDINGETQSNKYSINIGNISMGIQIEMPGQVEKSGNDIIKINAKNLQGEDIQTTGTYTLYSLLDNDSINNKISEGSFKTGEQEALKSSFKNFASGKYQIQIKALDSKKNEVSEKKNFILYSFNDKKPPVKTNEWLVKKNTTFGANKPAEVIYGVSDKDIYVLYQLYNNKKVFERRFVKMSETNQLFTVPYKAEYGDEIYMSLAFVRDGRLYNQNILLAKEEEKADTKLNIKLEVFRDKLRPGQAETWTVSIKDTTNTAAIAELLASMYDVSLDQLYPYRAWAFNRLYIAKERLYPISYNYPSRYYWTTDQTKWFTTYNKGYTSAYNSIPIPSEPIDPSEPFLNYRRFDQLNWFNYIYQDYEVYIYSDEELKEYYKNNPRLHISISTIEGSANTAVGIDIAELREHKVIVQESAPAPAMDGMVSGLMVSRAKADTNEFYAADSADTGGGADAMDDENSVPQIRQNFNETAFFYPQLRTNEKGETLISFTVPESNTTWRFRALAHDKNSRVGMLDQFVVTQKELIVTPNMPRFVRQGDKTSISTKISNLSDNAISGDVRIEFFDPVTDKPLNLNIPNQKQTFSVEKDASVSTAWTFDVPEGIELIGCRIIAQNQTFSDGEQHVLAVLPNRMLVTESMPIDVTKSGTNTFTFDKLYNNASATASNYKLTLEYASNPAWYAVQALPSFSNPTNENAVNWFASYYVNTLGSSLTRQYPKVASMIEAWKKQGGNKQTFVSKLQKDEELKNVLLEETPWVLDAKNETEQMQRLSLLFDLNNTKQQTDAATRKLQDLQNSNDGGWSWYKGMYPSRSVTQYILYGYAKLQLVGQVQYPQEIKMMQMNALKFIDSQIFNDFESLKKNNKNWEKTTYVSTNQLEFAYVRSFYRDIPIDQGTRAAERFYTNVASKNWQKLDLYEKSILSAVLKRNGEKELADKIVKSIREHAVKGPKAGMYWPNNRSQVFMSMSAISVHTFLMDALQENGSSQEEMDMLKRWLLNQKRTQIWESTHASIDAISALLSSGSDWFAESESPVITVGSKKLEPETKEAGTGYFKKVWDKGEISNDMGKVEVTTSDIRPAYGAMYWQYYENLDKITADKGDLNVEKQLFKETQTTTGKSLSQITENNPLTVGDKVIVRVTVRTDKDMEFVQLKDMRASCFEPVQTISGVKWNERLRYYQTSKDASTNFYFDFMPKGTYVFEYPVYVNRTGEYANGITSIQCMYAPEYVSHTAGIKVTVKDKQ